MKPCIEVRDLCKSYGSGNLRQTILDHCSFTVEPGKLTAVIGRSGSGKTTLLEILGGLLEADQGDVLIEDTNLCRLREAQRSDFRASRIGFVFQSYELLEDYTVSENIRFVSDLQGKPFQPGRLGMLIEALDLQGLEDRIPDELSGGEQQRVAIARALYPQPAIVLADEPTGNLDARSAEEVFSLLKRCARELGQTILMVTHDLSLARQADAVLSIEDGEVRRYEQ